MEGVGARLGRSSTRYGPATVFTGPVRRWKKKWVHVTPPNTTGASSNSHHQQQQQASINSNGDSSSNGSNDTGSHLMLYKWTPISQSISAAGDNISSGDAKDEGAAGEEDEEPPRRKIKYIPIALLEEQKKESPEQEHIDEAVEIDPNSKVDDVDGKPDINDLPMEENEASEDANAGRQDLNESKLDLNARDGNEDGEAKEDQEL